METVIFALAVSTIPLHFASFMALRRVRALRTERGILLFHVTSAAIAALLALLGAAARADAAAIAIFIAIVFAHGIYSLTFLEFWTLSQISYSREVLVCAAGHTLTNDQPAPATLISLGEEKRAGRLESLSRLGLVLRTAEGWELTARGRIVSTFLRALQWLTATRDAG